MMESYQFGMLSKSNWERKQHVLIQTTLHFLHFSSQGSQTFRDPAANDGKMQREESKTHHHFL